MTIELDLRFITQSNMQPTFQLDQLKDVGEKKMRNLHIFYCLSSKRGITPSKFDAIDLDLKYIKTKSYLKFNSICQCM